MDRIFTIALCFIISIACQGQYLKMATLASWGGTGSPNGSYMSHLLGQSSVISGTVTRQGFVLRQGFKQPIGLQKAGDRSTRLQNYEPEIAWSYLTFPNPFVDHFTVRFDQPTPNPISILLYDIQGKILWQSDYSTQTKEVSVDKLQELKAGKYILQVIQKGKTISQSLIKQSN